MSTADVSHSENPLPDPYSDDLKVALRRRDYGTPAHQHIYACLYERRNSPPTDSEIGEFVFQKMGKRYSQLQRRRRQLGEIFEIEKCAGYRYQLVGWRPVELAESSQISQRVRYAVLQSGRCKLCGRSVEIDGVSLVVDHVLPQAWGGTDEQENLQPLCTECNAGKKDFYGDFEQYSDKIKAAASADEPHRRIALLLKAFDGEYVPSELLGAVASAKQYQEDWQKRTRELRKIGIDYSTKKRKLLSGRVVTDWRLTKWTELPSTSISAIIRRIEREQKTQKLRDAEQ